VVNLQTSLGPWKFRAGFLVCAAAATVFLAVPWCCYDGLHTTPIDKFILAQLMQRQSYLTNQLPYNRSAIVSALLTIAAYGSCLYIMILFTVVFSL
jgi:hypothetical protein